MEWKQPSVIALKGFPFTGKTSLARDLACHLRFCLLLSLEDVLDSMSPPAAYSSSSFSAGPTSRARPAEAEELIAKAFKVLCVQAERQLSIGQSVIIHSLPLSLADLNRLAGLSKSAKVIIVECQIDRTYAWEMRFKKEYPHDEENNNNNSAWYKTRHWGVVTDTVKGYDKRLDKPVRGVSRLYLNVDEEVRGRHVIEAIQALVFCEEDRHVDYRTWNSYILSIYAKYECKGGQDHDHSNCGHGQHSATKELLSGRQVLQTSRSCKDGHRIAVFTAEGLVGYEADCLVCDNPVIGPAYACNSCQAALHKSCAELQYAYTPQQSPVFIKKDSTGNNDVYSFPENFPCFHCKEFSDSCSGCINESLLKCRLVPTVIEHEGHAHKLSLWAMKIKGKGEYTCQACNQKGAYAAYSCYACCTNYHLECALLPYPIKDHNHGGYQHTLELLFTREDKEFDDFPCSYCGDNMSPEDWYFYCSLCDQTYHLKCAFDDDA